MIFFEKRLLIPLILGASLSAGVFVLGYFFLISPIKDRKDFLQIILLKREKAKAVDLSLIPKDEKWMDEKKELMRWSSSQGMLLSWKASVRSHKHEFIFDWVGSYTQVLHLLKNWPVQLKIMQMHWKRASRGGVQWSGHYENVG